MNIDIRDIDSNFETDLRNIMQEFEIATASKAVRHAVTNFSSLQAQIQNLKRRLLQEEEKNRKLEVFKRKAFDFMDLFKIENDGN